MFYFKFYFLFTIYVRNSTACSMCMLYPESSAYKLLIYTFMISFTFSMFFIAFKVYFSHQRLKVLINVEIFL